MDLIAALRRHPLISGSWGGFGPIEVLDMRANEKGTPNFAGVLNHHTVSGENSGKYPSKSICQNGRGGSHPVPGPLCNILGARGGGSIGVISNKVANHAGRGDPDVLRRVRAGIPPKSRPGPDQSGAGGGSGFIGIEWENCLAPGTSVLTDRGFIKIEDVQVGDLVWTHKDRWRPVYAVIERPDQPLVNVSATGLPNMVCSPDHAWLTKSLFCGKDRAFDRERWIKFDHEDKWTESTDLIGSMLISPSRIDPPTVPAIDGFNVTPEIMWIAGSWVADGSVEHEVYPVLNIRNSKSDRVRGGLDAAGLRWSEREVGEVTIFRIASKSFGSWLQEHFGTKSLNKTIPAWMLGVDKFASPFIDGYMDGDGWIEGNRLDVATSSRCLAFGLKMLCQSVGMYAIVHTERFQYPDGLEINGVKTQQNSASWRISVWPTRPNRAGQHDLGDGRFGLPVRSLKNVGVGTLWDLKVEDDHSFVADGVITHNSGTGEKWTPQMINTMVRVNAALCDIFGWDPATSVIGHLEWTTRKIDPAFIDPKMTMNDFRKLVVDCSAGISPEQPKEWDEMATKKEIDDVVKAHTDVLEKQIAGLTARVDSLAVGPVYAGHPFEGIVKMLPKVHKHLAGDQDDDKLKLRKLVENIYNKVNK